MLHFKKQFFLSIQTLTTLFCLTFSDTVLPKAVVDHIYPIEQNPMVNHDDHEPQPDIPTPVPILPTTTQYDNLTLPITKTVQTQRPSRIHKPPSYLQDYQCNVKYPLQNYLSYENLQSSYKHFIGQVSTIHEPSFYHQAVSNPEWRKAMAEEIAALEANNTWSVQTLPKDKKVVGCRGIYKVKYIADGSLDRYKARLVAQGFTQQAGVDFLDTFSLVAKLTTMRILLSTAAQKQCHFIQLDINNAFLNGDLDEEVYMKLPKGYSIQGENLVCKLNKSLYGLRQASRQWY